MELDGYNCKQRREVLFGIFKDVTSEWAIIKGNALIRKVAYRT